MARTYLEAFATVRPIVRVRVYSPTPANREAFAREMSDALGVEVEPVATAREAVRGADILATCTDSMCPTFEAEWLEPGMHVTMLGPREVSDEVLARCDVKVRQGAAGLRLPESDRLQAEIGHSPMAYIAGTAAEMQCLPEKGTGRGSAATPRSSGSWRPATCRVERATSRSPITTTSATRACSSPASADWSTARRERRARDGRSRPSGSCRTSATDPEAGRRPAEALDRNAPGGRGRR